MTKDEMEELVKEWLSKKGFIEEWNYKHGKEAEEILNLREDINYYLEDYDDLMDSEMLDEVYELESLTGRWLPSSMSC